MADRVSELLFPQRAIATIVNAFGLAGFFLCITGLFAMITYTVKQRTREIGIRMALGAEMRHVIGDVLAGGIRWSLLGIGCGLAISLTVLRILQSQLANLQRWNKFLLYGVNLWDALTLVAVPLLVLIVALLACYVPARRAAKIDPMEALRHE